MIHVMQSLSVKKAPTLKRGTFIVGSEIRGEAIEVERNNHDGQEGYVARVYCPPGTERWVASTLRHRRGIVVYVHKKPEIGQKIKISKVYTGYAKGVVV